MKKYILLLVLCAGCGTATKAQKEDPLVSMQVIDRNGFSETISAKERLEPYQKMDFCEPQPYQKVLRIFEKDESKRSKAILTSYHSNGYLWQYLESLSGRAHGMYREYFPNGMLKIECLVIEGMADLHEKAQASWVFDGKSNVFDEEGNLVAEIFYEKGKLEGTSYYYFPGKKIKKIIPYQNDEIESDLVQYDIDGNCIEKTPYHNGKRHGISQIFWTPNLIQAEQLFDHDSLIKGEYFDVNGNKISQIENGNGKRCLFKDGYCYMTVAYLNGAPEGEVCLLNENQIPINRYHVHNGKKDGDEWEYYPSSKELKPKLYLLWNADRIQMVKTWYENGVLESQKEMNEHKKHGMCFAWYQDGSIMFVEEYESDKLVRGSYYKKGDSEAFSVIDNGKGTAILYDKEGKFYKKVLYENGKPIGELY